MNEVKVIGQMDNTIDHTFESANRVYDTNGISPTLNTCGGGGLQVKIVEPVYGIYTGVSDEFQRGPLKNVSRCLKANNHDASVIYQEPVIVASRGRNPQNTSDRTPGNYVEQRLEPNSEGICNTLTSVQKDNSVLEPAILCNKRTDYGKAIRKAYESGAVKESRHNMTELQPRDDGISNTLTTVQKDNLLLEPTVQKERYEDLPDVRVIPVDEKYRIRKLTPLECWRLMDFTDEDFYKAKFVIEIEEKIDFIEQTEEKVNKILNSSLPESKKLHHIKNLSIKIRERTSNTQLYKQAGNSIVRAVLMAIFRQMLPNNS
jgi:DNA (cytosine-5)-methyltransferase 1